MALWTPDQISDKVWQWIDYSDSSTRTQTGSNLDAISDKGPGSRGLSAIGTPPVILIADQNGLDTIDSSGLEIDPGGASVLLPTSRTVLKIITYDSSIARYAYGDSTSTPDIEDQLNSPTLWFSTGNSSAFSGFSFTTAYVNMCHIYDLSTTTLFYFVNAVELGDTSLATANPRIRFYHNSPSTHRVGEEIIFNEVLSVSDRQLVEGYLHHKWGLPLPAGHPYENEPPMVTEPPPEFESPGNIVKQTFEFFPGCSATVINTQTIYQGRGAEFFVSDPLQAAVVNPLNFATAEYVPDNLQQVWRFKENLILAGEKHIEFWFNSGSGNPPFERISQATVNIGVASCYTIANSDTHWFFLGSDRRVYRSTAYQPQPISDSFIDREIRELDDVSDAHGHVIRFDGQTFYIIQFPSGNLTLAYSNEINYWTTLSSGTGLAKAFQRHILFDYAYIYQRHLFQSSKDGRVYSFDFDKQNENIRQRDSQPITARTLGLPQSSRILMSKLDLVMETGVGTLLSKDPQIMVSFSIDGGRSFGNTVFKKIGRSTEPVKRIQITKMISFYELVIRVRVSDPAFMSIHSADITARSSGY